MKSKNKFVTTIYDIFGYSIIGIIAFGFGLLLQNYNSQNDLFKQFIQYSRFSSLLILLIAFHCLLICLFGFSYAVVIFHRAEQNDPSLEGDRQGELYNNTGKWIEIILAALFISVMVTWVLDPSAISLPFWGYLLCSGLLFILPSVHYRVKAISVDSEGVPQTANWTKQTKYVLICPAILMIGVNIYLGACILELLRGNVLYYLPIAIFFLFFLAFFSVNKPLRVIVLIIIFSVVLSIVGFFSFSGLMSMPFKNMFLAIMVSIFLSIFECWYIAFRQLKDAPNKRYITVTSYIITFTPAVVITLYPVQDFNIIYIFTFFGGMLATQLLWFFKILPRVSDNDISSRDKNRLRKQLGILRAIFGILVLLFLMLDKQIGKQVTNSLIRKQNFASINILGVFTLFGSISPLIDFVVQLLKGETKKDTFFKRIKYGEPRAFLQLRLLSYIFPIGLMIIMDHFGDLNIMKRDISWFLMFIFSIIDFAILIYYSSKQKEREISQNSSKE